MSKIIVYTSTGCSYCRKIKDDLKKWGINDYEERNVQENPDYFEELNEKGIMTTPVTMIGDEAVIGYRPNKMKEILGV